MTTRANQGQGSLLRTRECASITVQLKHGLLAWCIGPWIRTDSVPSPGRKANYDALSKPCRGRQLYRSRQSGRTGHFTRMAMAESVVYLFNTIFSLPLPPAGVSCGPAWGGQSSRRLRPGSGPARGWPPCRRRLFFEKRARSRTAILAPPPLPVADGLLLLRSPARCN